MTSKKKTPARGVPTLTEVVEELSSPVPLDEPESLMSQPPVLHDPPIVDPMPAAPVVHHPEPRPLIEPTTVRVAPQAQTARAPTPAEMRPVAPAADYAPAVPEASFAPPPAFVPAASPAGAEHGAVERSSGPASPVDEEALTERILVSLQRQIELMLEYRVRESLAPVLTRAADGLIQDARVELASSLRDVVSRAVAQEVARLRGSR